MKNYRHRYKLCLLVMLFGIYCNAMEKGFFENQKELLLEKVNQASSQCIAQNSRFAPNIVVYKGSPHSRTLETSDGHVIYVPYTVAKESTLLCGMLQCKKDKRFEPGKLLCDAESLANVIKLSRQKNNIDKDNCGPFLEIANYVGLLRKKMIPAACYYLDNVPREKQEEHIRNIALQVAPCIDDMSYDQLEGCIEQTNVLHNNTTYQHINLSNKGLYSLRGLDRFITLFFSDPCTFDGNCSKSCINTIQTVSLAHNKLTSFDPSLFYNFQHLREIDLSYNNITRLDKAALYHNLIQPRYHFCYNYLEKISLAHNKLTEVDQSLCAHYPYLLDIDLSDNAITSLKKGDFVALSKKGAIWEKIAINLSNNQIKVIEKGAFKKFFNGTINFDNNRLDTSQINQLREFFKLSRPHLLGKYLSKKIQNKFYPENKATNAVIALSLVGSIFAFTYKIANASLISNRSLGTQRILIPLVFVTVWLAESAVCVVLQDFLSEAGYSNATTVSAENQKK